MSTTNNLGLFKHDNPATNTNRFDVDKALNQNWDKIDTEVEKVKTRLTTLETDNTTNKKDISNIKEKNTEQDKYISELEAENVRLREDLSGLPRGQASGESIDINDSTDMRFSEFKISGNSEQETRSGKNLFNANADDVSKSSEVTIDEDYILMDNDNSDGTAIKNIQIYKKTSTELEVSTNYYLIMEVKEISGTANSFELCSSYSTNSSNKGQFATNTKPTFSNLEAGKTYVYEVTTRSDFSDCGIFIRTLLQTTAGQKASIKFRLSLIEKESQVITPDTFEYEAYGVMPSTEYPSEIKSVENNCNIVVCNKNIFDKDNANILNMYPKNGTLVSSTNSSSFYIPIKPNSTVCVSRNKIGKKFALAELDKVPAVGSSVLSQVGSDVDTSDEYKIINTSSKAKYLIVFYSNVYGSDLVNNNGYTEEEIRSGIQVEYNSIPTEFVQHQEQLFTVPIQQPFRAIGDIRDTFVKADGKWYERHYIKEYEFTGADSDAYYFNADNDNTLAVNLHPNNESNIAFKYASAISAYCNKFEYGNLISDKEQIYITGAIVTDNGYYGNIRLYLSKTRLKSYSESLTTTKKVDLVKEWLKDNPFIVNYISREPVDIECTTKQSAILDKIEKEAKTYKNITHIYSTDEVSANVELTYKKDIETLFANTLVEGV